MFKLANQILDAYDDVNKLHLKKVAKLNPKIYMMSPNELKGLDDDDFALTVITKKASKMNKFPVSTPDNAWLSNQYFEHTNQRMPKTAAAIAAFHIGKACENFGIEKTPAVAALAKEASSNVYYEEDIPQASQVVMPRKLDMQKFAQVANICDNYTFAQYAFATTHHVKLACRYFEKYRDSLPMEWRHKYAAAIQKRAKELGMGQQSGQVAKYASDYYSAHVDAHLRSRASLLQDVADPKFTSALSKLGAMKSTLEPMDFAKVLHGFDKRAGLTKYYGGHLTDPYQATFASELPDPGQVLAKTASGQSLTADEISSVASGKYDKIKEYFGSSIADELKKEGLAIFDSLPNDAKEVIVGIANGSL